MVFERFCKPVICQSLFRYSYSVMRTKEHSFLMRNYSSAIAFNKLHKEARPTYTKYKNSDVKVLKQEDLLIECKRPQFNLSKNHETVHYNLASQGWTNRKSNGDFFIIHPCEKVIANDAGTFEGMNVHPKIAEWLRKHKFIHSTEIQAAAMEPILKGHNVLLAAETGCGKTLAYLLPMLQQLQEWSALMENELNSPLGIIITPGRELAIQIGDIASDLTNELGLNSQVLLGGGMKSKMMNPTFEKTDLIVATLGALSKLVTTKIINLSQVRHVVLDEADTLLDDSFNEKVKKLLSKIPFQYHSKRITGQKPEGSQLTLVTATIPKYIGPILEGIIDEESLVQLKTSRLHQLLPTIKQKFQRLGRLHRPEELLKVAKTAAANGTPMLIFSNKSSTCDWISIFLNDSSIKCVNFNGDIPRIIREGKFQQFQDGVVNILSTTDVGSRGLDTTRAQLILNYDFPVYIADYIHRCGRIGRISSTTGGTVINFVCGPMEAMLVQSIEEAARKKKTLPNVNANITRIIDNKALHKANREMKPQVC